MLWSWLAHPVVIQSFFPPPPNIFFHPHFMIPMECGNVEIPEKNPMVSWASLGGFARDQRHRGLSAGLQGVADPMEPAVPWTTREVVCWKWVKSMQLIPHFAEVCRCNQESTGNLENDIAMLGLWWNLPEEENRWLSMILHSDFLKNVRMVKLRDMGLSSSENGGTTIDRWMVFVNGKIPWTWMMTGGTTNLDLWSIILAIFRKIHTLGDIWVMLGLH